MGTKLRIVFRVAKNPDGSWKTLLDSPDQGVKDIPVSETVIKGDSLIFKSAAVMGTYEGLIQPDGKTVLGTWKQGGTSFPLTLSKTDQAPTVNRPQEPKPPFPYKQEEVAFKNEKAGIVLSGTLTLPEQGGPFAAVVMITGSGPQDRDEQLFGHKPFLVIADYLAERCRRAPVRRPRNRQVDGRFCKGHVRGFRIRRAGRRGIPQVAKRRGSRKNRACRAQRGSDHRAHGRQSIRGCRVFVILLAGPGMNGENLMYLQAARIQQAMGVDEKTISGSEATQRKIFEVLNREKDDAAAAKELREILNEAAEGMTADEKAKTKFSEAMIDMQIKQVLAPWFRYFIVYDPVIELKRLQCPCSKRCGARTTFGCRRRKICRSSRRR